MTNREKYYLIQDDDGHWYLTPFDKKGEAEKFLEAIYDYWTNSLDGEPPEIPDWLKQIDGWHRLTFENPVEE
jgi:hypothetical protein